MQFDPFDINTVEDFISGDCTPELTSQINTLMSSDPAFKSEIDLQKDIISGINDGRKAELKNRLAGLKPMPNYAKIIRLTTIGVAAATLTSIGIYSYLKPQKHSIHNVESSMHYTLADIEYKNHGTLSFIASNNIIEVSNKTTPSSNERAENIWVSTKKAKQLIETANKNNQIEKENISSPETPLLIHIENETTVQFSNDKYEQDSKKSNNTKPLKLTDSNISVKVKFSEDKFAYIFDGENLTLIGDFDKDYPYTVYELNYSKKMFFIYYKETYYHLEQSASVKTFDKVYDKATIEKLQNLNK